MRVPRASNVAALHKPDLFADALFNAATGPDCSGLRVVGGPDRRPYGLRTALLGPDLFHLVNLQNLCRAARAFSHRGVTGARATCCETDLCGLSVRTQRLRRLRRHPAAGKKVQATVEAPCGYQCVLVAVHHAGGGDPGPRTSLPPGRVFQLCSAAELSAMTDLVCLAALTSAWALIATGHSFHWYQIAYVTNLRGN